LEPAAVSVAEAQVPRAVDREAESGMTFLGLVGLGGPNKAGVQATVADLDRMGVGQGWFYRHIGNSFGA
jgi:magnesium-transporting ATPase (P-type)